MITEDTGSEEVGTEELVVDTPIENDAPTNETEVDAPDGETAEVVQDQYTPNYGFKVGDETREMDEWIRSTITDSDSEARVRDLMERAHGLDLVKEHRQRLRDENTTLQGTAEQFDTVKRDLENVGKYIQNGDIANVLESLNIPRETVYKWTLEQAELQKMQQEDPQGFDRYQRQTTIQNQNYQLQQQNDMLVQQQQQFQTQQIMGEMDQTMNQPEVASAAQQFDERMGRQGAFREEIINRGRMHYTQTGVDRRPSEIINEVVGMLGYGHRNDQQSQQTETFSQPSPVQPKPRRTIETMPNVSGRGTSPVKKVMRSIDDIRRRSNELNT